MNKRNPAKPQLKAYKRAAIALFKEVPLRARKPFRGAEVGVAVGMLSKALLNAHPRLQLWMIDSWRPPAEDSPYRRTNDMRAKLSEEQQEGRYQYIKTFADSFPGRAVVCRGASTEWADFAARLGLTFSAVFIDADHSYEGVKQDTEVWWPLVKSGGLFSGHDYGSDKYQGVKQAVDEFASKHKITICQCDGLAQHVWYHFKE